MSKDYANYGGQSYNQRMITLNKEECDVDNIYAKINIEALNNAARNLTHAGFLLWIYFAQNQEGYTFWLSKVAVRNKVGVSDSSYHRAFKELVEKKYLIKDDLNDDYYQFYEKPQGDEEDKNIKIEIAEKQ